MLNRVQNTSLIFIIKNFMWYLVKLIYFHLWLFCIRILFCNLCVRVCYLNYLNWWNYQLFLCPEIITGLIATRNIFWYTELLLNVDSYSKPNFKWKINYKQDRNIGRDYFQWILSWCITAWKVSKTRNYFWSVFSYIRTEYGNLLRKYLYSVRIEENTD